MNVIFEHKVTAYEISGPVKKRSVVFLRTLRSNAFQQALINCLLVSWEDDANANTLKFSNICCLLESVFLI